MPWDAEIKNIRSEQGEVFFIDWETGKTFDRVDWNILLNVLKSIGIHWKVRRPIKELDSKQKVVARVDEDETKEDGVLEKDGVCRHQHY